MILVTGSSGRIGRAVVAELQARAKRVAASIASATPGLSDMVVGTLTSEADVARAMAGVRTVIHLAATPDDADFLAEIVPNNIIGVYHVFEQAQQAGVKRLDRRVERPGRVVSAHAGPFPIDENVQPTPRYWYAAAKMFLEAAGRSFAEKFGIEVIAVSGWAGVRARRSKSRRSAPSNGPRTCTSARAMRADSSRVRWRRTLRAEVQRRVCDEQAEAGDVRS